MRNHAFVDGNKRVAMAALAVFLDLNGYFLNATQASKIEVAMRAAASEMTEQEWTTWVRVATRKGSQQ